MPEQLPGSIDFFLSSLLPPFYPNSGQQNLTKSPTGVQPVLSLAPLCPADRGYFCPPRFAGTMLSPKPRMAFFFGGRGGRRRHPAGMGAHGSSQDAHETEEMPWGLERPRRQRWKRERAVREGFSPWEGHLRGTGDAALGTGGLREGGGRQTRNRGVLLRVGGWTWWPEIARPASSGGGLDPSQHGQSRQTKPRHPPTGLGSSGARGLELAPGGLGMLRRAGGLC